jgi:cobalamin synthase
MSGMPDRSGLALGFTATNFALLLTVATLDSARASVQEAALWTALALPCSLTAWTLTLIASTGHLASIRGIADKAFKPAMSFSIITTVLTVSKLFSAFPPAISWAFTIAVGMPVVFFGVLMVIDERAEERDKRAAK